MSTAAREGTAGPIHPELYRIREAAAILAISPRMLYALIESRQLPTVRLPGTGGKRRPVRIARRDLTAFLDRLREDPA
jgi:excisionase family DNA binding protein